jgi:hypothetical protein
MSQNLRYDEVCKNIVDVPAVVQGLTFDEIRASGEAFSSNVRRIADLAVVPVFAIRAASNFVHRQDRILFELFGTLEVSDSQFQTVKDQVQTRQQELVNPTDAANGWQFGANVVRDWSAPGTLAYPLLEALLSAQIIYGWTAFETLVTDLWKVLLDKYSAWFEPNLVKAKSKYKFRNLVDIENAYLDAFFPKTKLPKIERSFHMGGLANRAPVPHLVISYSGSGQAFADFSPLFKHEGIKLAHALRNILVHTGGIVDQIYLDRIRDIRWAPTAPLEKRITIDGSIVAILTDCIAGSGSQLMQAIDLLVSSRIQNLNSDARTKKGNEKGGQTSF